MPLFFFFRAPESPRHTSCSFPKISQDILRYRKFRDISNSHISLAVVLIVFETEKEKRAPFFFLTSEPLPREGLDLTHSITSPVAAANNKTIHPNQFKTIH